MQPDWGPAALSTGAPTKLTGWLENSTTLSKPQYALKASEVGALLRSENGAATAADLIEEFLSGIYKKETADNALAYASRN